MEKKNQYYLIAVGVVVITIAAILGVTTNWDYTFCFLSLVCLGTCGYYLGKSIKGMVTMKMTISKKVEKEEKREKGEIAKTTEAEKAEKETVKTVKPKRVKIKKQVVKQ